MNSPFNSNFQSHKQSGRNNTYAQRLIFLLTQKQYQDQCGWIKKNKLVFCNMINQSLNNDRSTLTSNDSSNKINFGEKKQNKKSI